ncbi:MAG: hypothetical protein QOF38_1297, partial [Pseudonocardiales bacterium]|nr:hypothetical protein [Pseudonocardiales bacterium]
AARHGAQLRAEVERLAEFAAQGSPARVVLADAE